MCLCVYIIVVHDVCPGDLIKKVWCHTSDMLQVYTWGFVVVSVMCHTLMVLLMTPLGQNVGQILKLSKLGGSYNIFPIHSSFVFGFGLKYSGRKSNCFDNFQNPSYVHVSFKLGAYMETRWQSIWRHSITKYFPQYSCFGRGSQF